MNEENEKLRELVFMAIGEASMCWSEVPSGVFESTRAKKIGDKLMEDISRHQSNPIDPDYAEFKAWKANGGKAKECENCHDTGFIDDIDWTGAVESLPCPACHGKALAPKTEAKTEEGLDIFGSVKTDPLRHSGKCPASKGGPICTCGGNYGI